MRLNSLLIENFGLFSGVHEIDLICRKKYGSTRPIILFGGMNGAGKTTLLEALQLALYGRLVVSEKVTQKEYSDYLKSRIHRSQDVNLHEKHSSVGVTFDFASMGNINTYKVIRNWETGNNNGGVKEKFEVLKDGMALSEVDGMFWQDFIKELIPPGLSKLFFFDGEKIQRLAEEENDILLFEAIHSLLGIDTIERLVVDLDVFKDRELKKSAGTDILETMARAEESLTTKEEELNRLHNKRADIVSKIDGIKCTIKNLEQKLTRQGGRFAENRHGLKEKKIQLMSLIEHSEQKIRDLTETELPFAFCPNLSNRLLAQLDSEQALTRKRIFVEQSEELLQSARKKLFNKYLPTVPKEVVEDLLNTIREEIHSTGDDKSVNIVHNISEGSVRALNGWLKNAQNQVIDELRKSSINVESSIRQLHEIELRLDQIPEEELLKDTMEELQGRCKKLANLETDLQNIEEAKAQLTREHALAVREIEKSRKRISDSNTISSLITLNGKCRNALTSYKNRLIEKKLEILQREISNCFRKLAHKNDLVQSIRIEPESFSISLFDEQGNTIPKKELSAGEKQIYAIAVLWGLARTSGRPLPMVIDTPLGRLDSRHRALLVEQYFPKASHQVIILSTDTELEHTLFKTLSPHISHSYHLDYKASEQCTTLRKGYFWNEGESME